MSSGVYQNRTLILAILDITKYAEFARKNYEEIIKYFSRHFKSVHLQDLSEETISNLNFSEELPEDIDILIYPTVIDLLTERVNGSLTAITKTVRNTGLNMLTRQPRSISVNSIDDVADKWTWIGIITSLFVISFLLSIYEFHRKNSKKKLPKHKILGIFFKYVWDSTMIFFLEPYETISKRISQRITCGVWILACVVIISEISGAMKSKYSFVVYDNIKSVDEIIPGSRWQPKTLKGQSEDRLFSSWATKEPKFKYIADKMEFFETNQVAEPDFYHDLKKEDILMILNYVFICGIGACFEEGILGKDEIPLLWVSNPIKELLIVFPISFEMSKSSTFQNLLDFYYFSEFQCKWLDMYENRYKFHLNSKIWHPQTTETSIISYKEVIPIFKLFVYGQIISVLSLLFEFIIAYYTRQSQF